MVLAALDATDAAAPVLDRAASLARAFALPLHIVHVVATAPVEGPFLTGDLDGGTGLDLLSLDTAEALRAGLHESWVEHLGATREDLSTAGLDVTAAVLDAGLDTIAETIAHEAETRGAAWIVVGSHGHGVLHDVFFGDTDRALVREAPCPVVVVPVDDSGESEDRPAA